MRLSIGLAVVLMLAASAGPAGAQSGGMSGMKMPMKPEGPANFPPTRQAYTENHQFLVKLVTLPQPIPYEKYFDLQFAVYDGHHPQKELTDAQLAVEAGMRHGLKEGFAHGMQSAPKLAEMNGQFTLSGMYFHMMGPWVVKLTVQEGGRHGTAYFRLPCCGT
jgi:hypothetical protein